jgi:hypothetical protein
MEPTLIHAVYDRAVLELDQTIKQVETDIMWNLIQSANKYKVLSKPFSELPFPLLNAEMKGMREIFKGRIHSIPNQNKRILFPVICLLSNSLMRRGLMVLCGALYLLLMMKH